MDHEMHEVEEQMINAPEGMAGIGVRYRTADAQGSAGSSGC